ncbi:hypothetical protein BLOT_010344 [Blomia tropicalis]|nr:hypothetical protein BLOT_010344 [Blomia tropicalis]
MNDVSHSLSPFSSSSLSSNVIQCHGKLLNLSLLHKCGEKNLVNQNILFLANVFPNFSNVYNNNNSSKRANVMLEWRSFRSNGVARTAVILDLVF